MNKISRRETLGTLAGLITLSGGVVVAAEKTKAAKSSPSPNPLVGKWTYRSFRSVPDISTPFDKLEFWRATLAIEEPMSLGTLKGRLDGDPGEGLALNGTVSYGGTVTFRFQGLGDRANSKDWVYDYLGFLIPQ